MNETLETIAFFVDSDGREFQVDHKGFTDPTRDWGSCTIYLDRKQRAAFQITAPALRRGRTHADMPASLEDLAMLTQMALAEAGINVNLSPAPVTGAPLSLR